MDSKTCAEALRQLTAGDDFASPAGLLRSINKEQAVALAYGFPYSIATNVKHASLWQDAWLAKLRGEPRVHIAYGADFPVVTAAEWADVRRNFLAGLGSALEIASAEPFVHHARDDQQAIELLLKIVNHGAYHIGQVALLKRLLRFKPEEQD